MGLIMEDNRFAVLTDILGDEDHLGDMDVKMAMIATRLVVFDRPFAASSNPDAAVAGLLLNTSCAVAELVVRAQCYGADDSPGDGR